MPSWAKLSSQPSKATLTKSAFAATPVSVAAIRAVGVASEPAGKPEERGDQGKSALTAVWVYAVFALLVGFSAALAFQPTASPGERDLLAARVAVASRLYQVQSLCGVSASPELLFLAELGSRACLSQQAIEQVRLLNGLSGSGPVGLADSIVQAMLEKNSDACVEAFERSRQICPALFHGMPERELRALRRASLL